MNDFILGTSKIVRSRFLVTNEDCLSYTGAQLLYFVINKIEYTGELNKYGINIVR